MRPAAEDVSVVIPVHGGWPSVEPLVATLLEAGHQVVVVDDASPDDGAAALARRHPGAEVVVRDVNGGFAAAVDTGMARARGAVLATVNSDVVVPPDALERLAERAATERAIVGPRTVGPDGAVAPSARRWQTIPRMLAEFFVPLRALPALDARLRDVDHGALAATAPVDVDWLVGACLVFPRDVWDRIGPLDERFHMNSEEVDWQLRAARLGIPRRFDPTVTITHVGGASSGGGDARFLAVWRSRLAYVAKHHGTAGALALRAGMVGCLAAMAPLLALAAVAPSRRAWVRRTLRRHARACVLPVPDLG